jgi:hypothetical protein
MYHPSTGRCLSTRFESVRLATARFRSSWRPPGVPVVYDGCKGEEYIEGYPAVELE